MTNKICATNFTKSAIDVSVEPIGIGLILGPEKSVSIENVKYDLGNRVTFYHTDAGLIVEIVGDEFDFYDEIVIILDGVRFDW